PSPTRRSSDLVRPAPPGIERADRRRVTGEEARDVDDDGGAVLADRGNRERRDDRGVVVRRNAERDRRRVGGDCVVGALAQQDAVALPLPRHDLLLRREAGGVEAAEIARYARPAADDEHLATEQ